MKINFILLLAIIFCSCGYNSDIRKKFDSLKNKDYSEFLGMNIVKRGGDVYVQFNNLTYKVKRNFFTRKITLIEDVMKKQDVLLSSENIKKIEKILKSFDRLDILSVSVDDRGDVFLTISWKDQCMYYFLKLSSINNLENIKGHYKNYEDNWYLDRRCSK